MNPPWRWPLDPRRQQAPRPRPGRFAGRKTPHDPHYHQPPTHGGDLCPRRGTRPPLARRRRRARLPSALGLVSPRRPHRHSPHHGPRLAACRVVAHRDEGITRTAPRPGRSALGAVKRNSGRGGGRARCSRPTAESERRRLRGGSGGGVRAAEHSPGPYLRATLMSRGKPCGLSPAAQCLAPLDAAEPAAPDRLGQRPAAMDGVPANTLALAAAGCANACGPQRWRFLPVTSRRTVHGQPARHRYGASTPRLKTGTARCGRGVLACRRVVDLARVSGRAGAAFMRGCRAGPISFRSGSAQGVLVSL